MGLPHSTSGVSLLLLSVATLFVLSNTQPSSPTQCTSVLDLVFIVDSSGSIRDTNPRDSSYDNWHLALEFISNLVGRLHISEQGTRVGLAYFSNSGHVVFRLNEHKTLSLVQDAVLSLRYAGGNTNTSGGLNVARQEIFNTDHGDRPDVPNVAIVITDGRSTYDSHKTVPSAEAMRAAGVKVFAIGISSAIKVQELKEISSPPQKENENYFTSADFQELDTIVEKVIEETCRVTTEPPPKCNSSLMDLVFVIDSSGSIRESGIDNWGLLLQFVANVVNGLDVRPSAARIGVVRFSNVGENIFFLNSYSQKSDVILAVQRIAYVGANTNTSGGIRVMRTEQFLPSRGDRQGVPNIGVVVTDGASTYDNQLTIPEAEAARRHNIRMYSVGITAKVNEAELKGMSSVPQELGQQYWVSRDFSSLDRVVDRLLAETCGTVTPPAPTTTPTPSVIDKLDLVIILDASSSMSFSEWNVVLGFLSRTIDHLNIGFSKVRVGLVRYANMAENMFYLNTYYSATSLKTAINNIGYIGSRTNTAAGLRVMHYEQFAAQHGDRADVYDYALLVTAGASDVDQERTIAEAMSAKISGIRLLAVGIGNRVDVENEVRQISSEPHRIGKNYWMIPSYSALDQYIASITSETLVTQAPTFLPVVGKLDLVLILDASSGVSFDDWNKVLQFITSIIDRLSIGINDVRVGLVRYSGSADNYFYLNTFVDAAELKNAIFSISYIGSSTNLAAALREMHYRQFTASRGDRSDVMNYALLITASTGNVNQQFTLSEAMLAKTSGINILAIGISTGVLEEDLRQISSGAQLPGVSYWMIPNYSSLQSFTDLVTVALGVVPTTTTISPLCELNIIDLVFVVDNSPNIRATNPTDGSYDNWDNLLDFAANIVSHLNIGPQASKVGFVSFSHLGQSAFLLDTYMTKSDIVAAIKAVAYVGLGSNIADGLREMHYAQFNVQSGDRLNVANIAILLTGAIHQTSIEREYSLLEATAALRDGIHMIAVGVTDGVDESALKLMTSQPQIEGVTYWKSPDFNVLDSYVNSLIRETCASIGVSSVSTTASTTASTTTSTTASTTSSTRASTTTATPTTASTRAPIHTTPTSGCTSNKMDLVFVLDNSGSIRDNNPDDGSYDNWTLLLQFVSNIIERLNIGGVDGTKVGVVSYSATARSIFYLNTYIQRLPMIEAVNNIGYVGSFTNTSGGINEMLYNQFTVSRGDRPQVDNMAIIITDGVSNIDTSRTVPDAVQARNAGVKLLTVGITDAVDVEELKQMSSAPQVEGVTYWRSADFTKLDQVVDAIVEQTCEPTSRPAVPGDTGATGRTGGTGATGLTGSTGSHGPRGDQGSTGNTGAVGDTGANGLQGQIGATGMHGATGASGAAGRPGSTGVSGRDGIPGHSGATGSAGLPGVGRDGISGATGRDGLTGSTGARGTDGHRGSTGQTGQSGLPGFDGRTGATGYDGQNGTTGSTGATGIHGMDGETGSTGRTGPTGNTGSTGAQGSVGHPGATGMSGREGRIGGTGHQGRTGATGMEGRTGSTGAGGSTGHTGLSGMHGSTGIFGPTGATGAEGRTGATGVGHTGSTGATGAQGLNGSTGVAGVDGHDGATGVEGPTGATGNEGRTGGTGATGLAGRDGRTGDHGATGEQGSTGATGETGFEGRGGSTGSTGPYGRTGSTGHTGFSGLHGATGSPGLHGATGIAGLPGGDGRTGSTGRTGEGRTGSIGAHGADGHTGSTGSTGVRGFPGFPGAPGQEGRLGATGSAGAQGRTGSTGLTGRDGHHGATGHHGSDGFTGSTGSTGPEGQTGSIGFSGREGMTGSIGSTGRHGLNGRTGSTGAAGFPGRIGATGLQGHHGNAGMPGITGSTGIHGPQGSDGRTGSTGSTGFPGRDGRPGATGMIGHEGNTGATGRDGAPGRHGSTGLEGRTGATGRAGFSGLPGSTGSSGIAGFSGRTGSTGAPGRAGIQGLKGHEGKSGATGQRGFHGIDGKTGSTGSTGRTGSTGFAGLNGRTGATGVTGRSGIPGSPGLRGFEGRTGATGSSGLHGQPGIAGNRGFDGRTGATGRQGFEGRPGATGLSGSAGVGITGSTGATGPGGRSGSPGRDGRTGATGRAGLSGRTGATGLIGRAGATGVTGQGRTGATGFIGRPGGAGSDGRTGATGSQGFGGRTGATGAVGPAGSGCNSTNECLIANGGCSQLCIDTYDSYHCACKYGFTQASTTTHCPGVSHSCTDAMLDIVFIIDSSDSIRQNNPASGAYDNWNLMLQFITTMVDRLNVGIERTRVGVVRFSNFGQSVFHLNTYTTAAQVKNAILGIFYVGGETNTASGLRDMSNNQFMDVHGDRDSVPNLAILITDGKSTVDNSFTVSDANAAHQKGIKIISVGVTSAIDENELRLISSSPQQKGKNYYIAADFPQLYNIRDAMLMETCSRQVSENTYCKETLADTQCFCMHAECDIRPVNSTECQDINECLYENGGCQQTCVNLLGSYRCECSTGFMLHEDYHTCADLNECDQTPCAAGQLCANTYGSYVCLNQDGTGGQVQQPWVLNPSSSQSWSGSTILGASVLSAVIGIVGAVAVVLAVRQSRKWNKAKTLKAERRKAVKDNATRPTTDPTISTTMGNTTPPDLDDSFASWSTDMHY